MSQKSGFRFILLAGILFSASDGVQIDLCLNSSGVISHISNVKFVRQWLLVSRNCETTGKVLLLNLTSTNLTCNKGDMSLGISAFGNIPNLCSFRRGGCFIVSSTPNSSFGCQREQIIYRDDVMPVTIALSKTASDVERGFEIQYRLVTGKVDSTNVRSLEEGKTMAPTTTLEDLTSFAMEISVKQSPSTQEELSALNSHAVSNAMVYLSLTIAFGSFLIIAVFLLALLLSRLSRLSHKETKGDMSKAL